MYIIICEIDQESRFKHEIGAQGWCNDDPEVWDGKGRWAEACVIGEIHMHPWLGSKCECMTKATTVL